MDELVPLPRTRRSRLPKLNVSNGNVLNGDEMISGGDGLIPTPAKRTLSEVIVIDDDGDVELITHKEKEKFTRISVDSLMVREEGIDMVDGLIATSGDMNVDGGELRDDLSGLSSVEEVGNDLLTPDSNVMSSSGIVDVGGDIQMVVSSIEEDIIDDDFTPKKATPRKDKKGKKEKKEKKEKQPKKEKKQPAKPTINSNDENHHNHNETSDSSTPTNTTPSQPSSHLRKHPNSTPIGINKRLKSDPLLTLIKPFKIPTKSGSPRPSVRHDLSRAASRKVKNYSDIEAFNDKENQIGEYETPTTPTVKRLGTKGTPESNFSSILNRKFITPLKEKPLNSTPSAALGMKRRHDFVPKPLHDPSGEFAIVLYDPTIDDEPIEEIDPNKIIEGSEDENLEAELNAVTEAVAEIEVTATPTKVKPSIADILGISNEKKKIYPKVPVVIDPRLAKILRPHQVEGVKFLYKCVTGRIQSNANGCIMADEMGLGKTLQCITLLWTLLKQSPEGNGGTINKCIVVCPSSLVRNWANELVKWLGEGTITPLAADGKSVKNADLSNALRQWSLASGRQIVRPVLIISYETLRRHCDDLKHTEIGLLLADEGHRLKNGESLTFTALDALNVQRRVILSGTPIQNDLSEYFSLLSFANPGLLGTRLDFRKNYELAILKGRDSFASDDEVANGEQKLKDLTVLVSKFIIRRTNDILSKYLPVKYEHVVFCKMTDLQIQLYNKFIASPDVKKVIKGSKNNPLKSIGILKKLCNHPDLLDLDAVIPGCEDVLPDDYIRPADRGGRDREVRTHYSGKFLVLERMLARIRYDTNDKIVIISNYTQTLDLVESMCRYLRYGSFRLDGKMAINKRQKLVDKFNNPESEEFVFLLSSKAGGCGLNLIGANRLILMDPDWNPAADQQALARVWRDGQKKDCFVYRFISTGTIEEKIFQRQSMKQSLSSCVVDEAEDVERLFSFNDLRQLFEYDQHTLSDTHDTFKCKRCKNGKQQIKAPAMLYGDATTWNHFTKPELEKIQDLLLRQELNEDILSFVFQYISH